MKRLVILILSLASLQMAFGQNGSLLDTNLPSKFFGWNRGIHIYLPPSYSAEPQRCYPVLYLHDGQNAFSSAGTNVAFGWGSWELDKTVNELSRAGKMQEIIMVAVDNSFERRAEYGGGHHPTNSTTSTAFENYAAFLITELKPKIDREFRTLPGATNTAVMGSSMGGICSEVLAWEHPEIFGGAASLSGADTFERTNFLNGALKKFHGQPKPFRIYLDSGVVDFMGGDDGCAMTKRVAAEFRRIGWTTNNLEWFVDVRPLTPAELEQAGLRRDKWPEAKTQHNEFYWRLRAWRALTFLFPPTDVK